MTYPRGGSEYGGYPGLVQPEPHDVNDDSNELLMLAQLTDPADPASSIESVADDIRRQARIDRIKQNGR
jgi:hypothetical protein